MSSTYLYFSFVSRNGAFSNTLTVPEFPFTRGNALAKSQGETAMEKRFWQKYLFTQRHKIALIFFVSLAICVIIALRLLPFPLHPRTLYKAALF